MSGSKPTDSTFIRIKLHINFSSIICTPNNKKIENLYVNRLCTSFAVRHLPMTGFQLLIASHSLNICQPQVNMDFWHESSHSNVFARWRVVVIAMTSTSSCRSQTRTNRTTKLVGFRHDYLSYIAAVRLQSACAILRLPHALCCTLAARNRSQHVD